MKTPNLGEAVQFTHNGESLTGIVVRVVKMSGPCQPTDDVTKWMFHVECAHESIRFSGTYCLQIEDLIF